MKHLSSLITTIKRSAAAAIAALSLLAGVVPAHATETIIYLHNDISGTPQAATDTWGNVLWKESYKPYGERTLNSVVSATGSGANQLYFHGKKVEALEGGVNLSYFGARYYDPSIGRFMGVDPAPFDPNSIHSFNRYAYGNNNPYKYVDPDGRNPLAIAMLLHIGGGAITGGATAGAINALGQLFLNGSVQLGGAGGVFDAVSEGAQIGMIVGPSFAAYAGAARGVTNPLSGTLARVVPGNIKANTLGRAGEADVFVTNASDIRGLSARGIAEKLAIPESSSFRVIEFPSANVQGIASPINRSSPGFVGGGRTAGGASEFVIPNGPIPAGASERVVR